MVSQYHRCRGTYNKCSILKLEAVHDPKPLTYPPNCMILHSELYFRNVIVSYVLKCMVSNLLRAGFCSEIHVRHEFWVGREGNVS